MTPLRLIVVGLGARARTWLSVVRANPDVQIVALCDPDARARDRAAHDFPGVAVAADLSEVTGVAADAALLCTPPGGRDALIETCCAHGIAILAEKPLADSVASASKFVDMAESAGVPLIVGLNFRYLGVTQALRKALDGGDYGSPEFGRFLYERWRDGRQPRLNKYPLTMPHPMLWEQSIHHFDIMRYVYRAEPAYVQAQTFNPSWSMYEGDANVSALFGFHGGIRVNYQGTWAAGIDRLDFDWRTDCTGGIVVQREMFGNLAAGRRHDAELTPIPLPEHEPWISDATDLLAMFVAIFRGAAPECTGRDHLQSLYMLEACIRASARRATVEIEEVRADAMPKA
ncbi:Gfo/Idh/MocA family protein [Flavimaricola marinus]|uniref:Putative 4,5-dihydroxyphthalate dehydrogenase n=1 Tax=Flavimaricola marinus TaxID=1819565 RepID=A0A238L9L0_9RHOB|nr:Gfo/Idh/MocA family oxidoreductase [Flavimaricola marinus]SMY06095.1 Putative 4,5-dihydroxyphthalate dehydrogenase [Flavimaricola marinus]